MKQQGFNLRVLMSVVLSFSLFLVAAVNGMEQNGDQQHKFKGRQPKNKYLTKKLTSNKEDENKRVKTAKIMAVASCNDEEDYNTTEKNNK